MKALSSNAGSVSSVHSSPAVAATHPSYRSPAVQAAAALHNLIAKFRLKKIQDANKAGRA
jgi:hypothetical protein